MPRDSTLHIKLDRETDSKLKTLAYARGKSKGQLVREALSACYQTAFDDLPLHQRQAVSAYQGGFISLGKLAQILGMPVLAARGWLDDHGVAVVAVYQDADARHA